MAESSLKLVKARRVKKEWPMFFYEIFLLPSERENKRAQEKIAKSLIISHSEIAQLSRDFSEGKISKGKKVILQEREYVFLGAIPRAVVLEMFWFFDESINEFCQLTYSFDGKNPL